MDGRAGKRKRWMRKIRRGGVDAEIIQIEIKEILGPFHTAC